MTVLFFRIWSSLTSDLAFQTSWFMWFHEEVMLNHVMNQQMSSPTFGRFKHRNSFEGHAQPRDQLMSYPTSVLAVSSIVIHLVMTSWLAATCIETVTFNQPSCNASLQTLTVSLSLILSFMLSKLTFYRGAGRYKKLVVYLN